jgi:protein TonB
MLSLQLHVDVPKKPAESGAAPANPPQSSEKSTLTPAQLKELGLVLPIQIPRKEGTSVALALPSTVKKDVFLNALLETPIAKGPRRNPMEWAGAMALHAVILAALIIIPLYTTGTISLPEYDEVPLVAPPPPPPPPAAAAAPVAPHVVRPKATLTYKLHQLTAPTAIPKKVSLGDSAPPPPDVAGVAGGVPGGVVGGEVGGVVGGVLGGTGTSAPPPPPPAVRKTTPKLVRAGSDLKAPRQTYSVDPEYPELARQVHIHGTVVVEATIDERGNVVNATALSGHPMLIPAALKAVLQWKYEPSSLNGQPVSVLLKVFVNFT